MNANELAPIVTGLSQEVSGLQRQLDKQDKSLDEMRNKSLDEMRKSIETLNLTVGKLQQKLEDYIAHNEKWDNRRWGIIGLFVAAVISLVANLVLAVARK